MKKNFAQPITKTNIKKYIKYCIKNNIKLLRLNYTQNINEIKALMKKII